MLVGITEIAVALAGFSGIVVALGRGTSGKWLPGDRLRLRFLLEASLTAGSFSLLALVLYSSMGNSGHAWGVTSGLWAVYMVISLYRSHLNVQEDLVRHGDVDKTANRIVFGFFSILIVLQLVNAVLWLHFAPLLAALVLNLAGAAMQFARLIRSAFQG